MSGLALRKVSKAFGDNPILHDVTIEADPGEFVALVGPSGCGKTTLLRIAAALDYPDYGSVWLGERDMTAMRPSERDIAMVFQSYALYPHLTAGQNIAVPLAMRNLTAWQRLPWIGNLLPGQRAIRADIQRRVIDTARSLKIDHLVDRKPGQMSGGQRQRVALGRALVRSPAAFLMDEPLSNLDANLRVHTRAEIVELHRRAGVTTLYVTHDQAEALSMADRVAVMMAGRLLQFDTPEEIYRNPAHLEVARFIGSPQINLLTGEVDAAHGVRIGGRLFAEGVKATPGSSVTIGIRPEALKLSGAGQAGLGSSVRRIEFLGSETLVFVELAGGGASLVAKLTPTEALAFGPGQPITISVASENVLVFGADGARLSVAPPIRMAANG
ncbi:glycerol-3-phosphate ABC transporter ATP-binding protein (plasmid) [Microvirga ossetica]|uniref:Glycerol-3-phosphate ABC transporter ATP-binding protein n=1 Tax=Microvirga ossetica TaxID=1882682 RepID=A0A1B2EZ39_9HYPH|nr:ABC transporter ATP-binding protein [Microvirga ossetica]ANY85202.1 glycerol-3-phosphate ABC transporter ATP-binding protein [Microvirga ossetica]